MSTLLDLMRSRRSVRRFRPDVPPRRLLLDLLEAATLAPSASNKQPWRFIVVTSRPVIHRLAGHVRDAVDRIAAHVEPDCAPAFRAYGDYFTRFEGAPVVIVAAYRSLHLLSNLVDASLPEADLARIVEMERSSGLIGTSLAIQNLLLRAPELGLGASGMTGPLVASDGIRAALDLPEPWEIAALIPVGYPAEEPPPTDRKPVERVTVFIEEESP